MLVITGGVGLFLAWQAYPTLQHYGWGFFTETQWQPEPDVIGIAAVLVGTISVALVAMFVAFPLALLTALYISEYAPPRIKPTLVSLVDLMAAVPVDRLRPVGLLPDHAARRRARALAAASTSAGSRSSTSGHRPERRRSGTPRRYSASAFCAGIAVAMMVLPMACAVMRQVFSQTPPGEKEAALALGATRWGMVRAVVLPFGRGGIIGGTMLGLGRALGETIAVVLIISPAFEIKPRILEIGTITVSSLIAGRFGEASAGAAVGAARRRLRALPDHAGRQHDRRGRSSTAAARGAGRRTHDLMHPARRPTTPRRRRPTRPAGVRRRRAARRPRASASAGRRPTSGSPGRLLGRRPRRWPG